MEVKKYWRNVIRGPFYVETEPGMIGTSLFAHHDEYKNGTTLGYHCINDNYEVPFAHTHNFHELLCFIGGNPENIDDLGAEISICLGEELEEHVITSATVVSIPPGPEALPPESEENNQAVCVPGDINNQGIWTRRSNVGWCFPTTIRRK